MFNIVHIRNFSYKKSFLYMFKYRQSRREACLGRDVTQSRIYISKFQRNVCCLRIEQLSSWWSLWEPQISYHNQFWPSIYSQPIQDKETDVPVQWLHKVTILTTLVVSARPAAAPLWCTEWEGTMTGRFWYKLCEIPPFCPERVGR